MPKKKSSNGNGLTFKKEPPVRIFGESYDRELWFAQGGSLVWQASICRINKGIYSVLVRTEKREGQVGVVLRKIVMGNLQVAIKVANRVHSQIGVKPKSIAHSWLAGKCGKAPS